MNRTRKYLYVAGALIIAAILVVVVIRVYFPGKSGTRLTVLCGGSFKEPVEKLVGVFEKETGIDVEISFGQSEDHLPHVKAHKIGDVFVSHSPYMEYTEDAQACSRWVPVGYVRPVLVVKKGSALNLEKVEDLALPGLKVALPNPEFSTCGEMIEGLFKKKDIWDDVKENVGNAFFRSHAQVATAIEVGNRDAGMMWNGVAHNWLDAIEIIPTPYEYDQVIEVGIIGLSYSKHPELVEEFLKSSENKGKEIFSQFGYTK
jgi:molybdate transport system substrate-binding protein